MNLVDICEAFVREVNNLLNAETQLTTYGYLKTENVRKNERSLLSADMLLFVLLWPLIILPKELQFIMLFTVAVFLLKKYKVRLDLLSFFLFGYIMLYTFSILINLAIRTPEVIRIVAAFNSLSIWVLAVLFYLIFKTVKLDLKKFVKIGFVNYSILICLWVVSILVHSITSISEVSLLTRTLYYNETFNQQVVTRFVGFLDYSNLIVLFCLFFYPLYFLHIRHFKYKIVQVLFLVIGILPLISSYSRSGYLVFGAALAIAAFYYIYQSTNRNVFYFFSFLSLSVLITVFFITNVHFVLFEKVEELMTARQGSNDSREIILAESINVTTRQSPIVGMGIKDYSSAGYPLGSHSTILGFFYKTGIFGLLIGTWIFIYINFKILFSKRSLERKFLSVFLFLMPFIFFVEDVDGANWLICMYFIFVAILLNDKNWTSIKKSMPLQ